jgi:hypothetical protein
MMKDLKFEELVAKFISDSEYQYILDFEKNFNFFDVCQIQREGSSAFLGWLLNPVEGHGVGSRVLKEFLLANYSAYEKYISVNDETWSHRATRLKDSIFFKEISKYDIATSDLKDVSVFYNVEFSEGTPSLVVLVHDLKTAVIVENRYNEDEAERTIDYGMIGSLPSGYRTLYSYIDKDLSRDMEKRINTNWVCLDYSWMEGFIENTIGRGILNPQVETMVRDFFIHLSGEYTESVTFERKQQAFENIFRSNEELIYYMKEYRFEGKRLVDLSDTDRFFARAKGLSKEIEFFLKHESILNELLNYADFAWIKGKVEETIASEFDFEVTVGSDYVSLYNTEWSNFLSTNNFHWGLDLFYYKRGESQEVLFSVYKKSLEGEFYESFIKDFRSNEMVKMVKDEGTNATVFVLGNVQGKTEQEISEILVEKFRKLSTYFANRSFARQAA